MKQPKNYELRVCTFDKDAKTVFIGNTQFVLSEKVKTIVWYEKEDAGGGWYWKGKGERKQGQVTDYRVYDHSGNYIGEVYLASPAHFLKPNTFHIKIPLTSLRYLPLSKKQKALQSNL